MSEELCRDSASTRTADELLWDACKYGDVDHCRKALEDGADPNGDPSTQKSEMDYILQTCSPLCVAAHKGFEEIVDLLLEKKANVNIRVESGVTNRTMLASEKSDQSTNRRRLISGHSTVLPHYDTPLVLAIKYGHIEIAKKLVEHGAEILLYDGTVFEKSSLQEVIRLNRTECLHLLYDYASTHPMRIFNTEKDQFETLNIDEVLLLHKNNIIKQCLINDNAEAFSLFIPILWNRDHLNSDLLMTTLSNLMLKNKVQTDTAANILQTILEHAPEDNLKMYDFAIFIKGFLRLLSARFLSISDERLKLLL